MNAHETLLAIQDSAARLVGEADYFAGIEIFTETKGDLAKKITGALAKLGLSVTVMTPDFEILSRQGRRKKVRVRVVVDCCELALTNQGTNGTQKPALAAATAAAMALDMQPTGIEPHVAENENPINELRLQPERPVRLIPDTKFIVYHAEAYTDTFLST